MPEHSFEEEDEVYVDVDNTESTIDDLSASQPSSSRKPQRPLSKQERPNTRIQSQDPDEDGDTDTLDYLYYQFKKLYNDRFGWTTFKSVIVFLIGLQYIDELQHLTIPLKNYCPFDRR